MTLGMMGVNLFGTCTMKYNARVNEHIATRLNEVHPNQDDETLQGVLEVIHSFEEILRERGIFGGGAIAQRSALYCVTEVHTEADIDRLVEALREVTA